MTEEEYLDFEELARPASLRPYPVFMERKYEDAIRAAFQELKERREDEEWLKKQTCYVFCYTHMDKSGCGFQIGSKCPDRTWGLGSTLHEAVEKARGYKQEGR